MKITYVYADTKEEWNSAEWRCAVPARAINRTGRHTAVLIDMPSFAQNTPEAQAACSAAEVIVLQRNLFGPVLTALQHWKARDKVIIADFDDAYQLIPPTAKNYAFWTEGKALLSAPGQTPKWGKIDPPPLTQFKWGLRLVHAATAPSRRLADDWKTFTEVFYLPNYIELSRYSDLTHMPHENIIIGWGGSFSHLQSFTDSGVLAALKRVCQQRPQVRVMLCGGDRQLADQLPIPPEQKILQPWVPAEQWSSVLANFDIGIAPLHGAYDERRSWIKVLEYLVMKIPWVASDGPAYRELAPYGRLVNNTPGAWERALLDMVDHIGDHTDRARGEPYLFGISQSIDDNIDKITNTYAAISQKVPGLAGEGIN